MLTRLGLGIVWLLHLLPLAVLAPIGDALGTVLYLLARERRHVATINLRLCFPQKSEAERARLVRAHFRALSRAFLEQGILWWSSRERIARIVRLEDKRFLDEVRPGQVIVLALHFVGLEMGSIRLTTEESMSSIYSAQKNPVFGAVLLRSRSRFGHSLLLSRQAGIRPVIRAMREGWSLFYLPDQDFGPKDAIFTPFFGVPAATVTGLSRLARLTGARVVPYVTRQLPGGQGYVARFYAAWNDFPGENVEADTLRMNRFIEERVLEMPEQYFWVHKRFKTRPPGQERFY